MEETVEPKLRALFEDMLGAPAPISVFALKSAVDWPRDIGRLWRAWAEGFKNLPIGFKNHAHCRVLDTAAARPFTREYFWATLQISVTGKTQTR